MSGGICWDVDAVNVQDIFRQEQAAAGFGLLPNKVQNYSTKLVARARV
jgi:hypothetical protein